MVKLNMLYLGKVMSILFFAVVAIFVYLLVYSFVTDDSFGKILMFFALAVEGCIYIIGLFNYGKVTKSVKED